MNLLRVAFELFLLYLLYKLVFDLIIPVARTTKQVKKQFSEMNTQMQDTIRRQQEAQEQAARRQQQASSKTPASKDDYIDFEEIK